MTTLDDIPLSSCARDIGPGAVDQLAGRGGQTDVWHMLERFPLIKANSESIWFARRDGRVRQVVERDRPDLATAFGPETREDWIALAQLCIWAAVGLRVAPEALLEGETFTYYPGGNGVRQFKYGRPDNLRMESLRLDGLEPHWIPGKGLDWQPTIAM